MSHPVYLIIKVFQMSSCFLCIYIPLSISLSVIFQSYFFQVFNRLHPWIYMQLYIWPLLFPRKVKKQVLPSTRYLHCHCFRDVPEKDYSAGAAKNTWKLFRTFFKLILNLFFLYVNWSLSYSCRRENCDHFGYFLMIFGCASKACLDLIQYTPLPFTDVVLQCMPNIMVYLVR
jgi:hypothetical protein